MYKFTDEGKLANSLLTISNLRSQPDGTCIWETVGEFSREEGLSIADIHWPGGQANPPQGTPEKFKLKVVTLLENPFIIASDLDSDTGPSIQWPCDEQGYPAG
uniref:Uncharacterized protein n=1 Tax=Plectus sambesii TaxID=2011161 RepID=A0A914X5R2_9BILA